MESGWSIVLEQRDHAFPLVKPPLDFERVATLIACKESRAPKPVVWRAVAPPHFVALGYVVTAGEKPALTRMR